MPVGNRAEIQRLTELSNRASTEVPVTGTPTFVINGTKQDVTAWAALEPLIRNAIPSRMKGRFLLAALAAAALAALPAADGAAQKGKAAPRSATGLRPSRARPRAAFGWAIPMRR